MAIEAQLADGRILEFPDGTDPSVIQATVKRVIAQSAPQQEQTVFGNVKELVKGVLPGAVGLVESAATGASALLPEETEKAAREKIKSVATAAKAPFTATPGYEEAVGRRLGEGLGSIVPAVPLAFMGVPGAIAGIGMGLASGAGEARVRAEEEGATAEQRKKATALGTIPGGFDTAIDMALAALPGGVGKSLSMVRRALVSGGVEGATEAAQAIAQNAIAKGIYKPNQALLEGSGEEGAYGAGVGALASILLDMAIPGRRAQRPTPTTQQEPPPVQQAPVTPEAEPAPKVEPEPKPALDLTQADYTDLVRARNELKQLPQTGEVRAQIKELDAQILSYHENEVGRIRAEKQLEDEARERFPNLAKEPAQQGLFPEIDVVRPEPAEERQPAQPKTAREVLRRRADDDALATLYADEAQLEQEKAGGQKRLPLRNFPDGQNVKRNLTIPTRPDEITMQDLEDLGLPMRSARTWLEQNVVGKTPAEIRVLVGNNPDLLLQKGTRAQVLKYLTAPVPEGYKEPTNVTTPTKTNKPKRSPVTGGGKPSVAVSGQPASTNVVQPGAGVSTTPGTSATSDGLGLAPAGQPAGKGANVAGTKPTTVTNVAPDVDSIESFPMGPGRVKPNVVKRDKPVYHETNTMGLDDLLRYDGQFEYSGAFVADNPDLALGQGANTGVFIEFRPNSVSGQVNPKIGTSPETGQEHRSDVIAPKAVHAVTIKAGTKFNPRPATRRLLTAEFDKTTLPDGSTRYVRKGATPSLALPVTWTPKANAPKTSAPKVVAKPTTTPPAAQKPKAPAPVVATETVDEEAARKAEAEDFKRRLEEVERRQKEAQAKADAARNIPSAPAEKPAPKPKAVREREDDSDPYAYVETPAEKEAKKAAEEAAAAEEAKKAAEKAKAAREAEEAKKAAEAKAAKEAEEAKAAASKVPDNIIKIADKINGEAIYHGPNGSIIKAPSRVSGDALYIPVSKSGDYFISALNGGALDIGSIRGNVTKLFTQQEFDALKAEIDNQKQIDKDNLAKFPDGPFTGAKSNVVAGASVDSRYTKYLTELMKSMGLGDVRVFLYHGEDVKGRANDLHLHGNYYPIMARANPDEGEEGATRPIGPDNKDFMLFINSSMSDEAALETIAHELGHMIQKISFDNAPAATKKAVMDEYDAWVASLKGKKLADLIPKLRNRYSTEVQEQAGITDIELSKMRARDLSYWLGFSEWFADNTSRWATTADKPLTITEKFFSRIAQMMRDLVAITTGRKFPPAKSVANFLDAMGPGSADMWLGKAGAAPSTSITPKAFAAGESPKIQNKVSYSTGQLVDSMGPLSAEDKNGLQKLIAGVQSNPDVDYVTKFRTQVTDIAATIEKRLSNKFDGAVRNSMGDLNPMGLYRQAQDYSKMLLEYFQTGTLYKDSVTGLWKSGVGKGVRPPAEVYKLLDNYAEKNGYSRERATQIASRVLEGVRLDAMRTANKTQGAGFLLHLNDAQIDQLLAEYNADPDLKEMSKLMDEARIAMVDNLVKVGRLTAEQGKEWKEVVGYVPFDRIEDFSTRYSSAKKISTKGIAQLGKLPELIGSEVRPVGNVFDNYINTLGWMVGQTLKTDATIQTLRSLEDAGFAKFLGRSNQDKPNAVGAYVNGEMMYYNLPSKYDLMAFKDLNPPKAGWLRALGAFSNVLRKTVTILPPFALKQVTDDVQRAILTSGVRNPGALIWMSLTNFPKLAYAELRGIQHPMVKDFGRLGLTGEYDFEAGKPAISLLKDLGFKKRGGFEELLHRLDGITRASDLAVRKAIYDQTLKESRGDELLAQTRAREFINFRRRGGSDFVGAMVTTIPFFNAYIQGMDVLYRAASGKDSSASVDRAQARQLFWSRATTVVMLSSLYALGKDDDDEDYKEMDLRTRDSNWVFPGGYKLPVPGELGAIFKVIPERIVEYMKRQGTPEEQTAFEAMRTTLSYMFEQYLGRAVPVPQAIKPVMEAWANKSFLTGRDLEGYHHKAMDPSARVNEQTSELAKTIAKFSRDEIGVEVSPIMLDNALRGYFGSSAAMFTMVTDSLLNPTRIDRPLHKYALLSNYLYDPVGTRRMTEFYEEREKVGKANTTLRELMKTDVNRAEAYAIEHEPELAMESTINSTLEQLERTRAYRKYLNSPDGAEAMSKEDRENGLNEIKKMEIEMVKWVREAQTELRKVQR